MTKNVRGLVFSNTKQSHQTYLLQHEKPAGDSSMYIDPLFSSTNKHVALTNLIMQFRFRIC